MQVVTEVNIVEYPLLSRGKVRDIYEIDSETLLMITTDRMSAFDVIMNEPIPYKGVVLNQITLFWMQRFASMMRNHLLESDVNRFPEELQAYHSVLEGRSVLVRRAKPLLVECIVRGYLAGSGWAEYQKQGSVCGHKLPAGLKESSKLETPIFTPSTKAEQGEHDVNITEDEARNILGREMFAKVRDASMAIFSTARDYAEGLGIIIADTKFEFGIYDNELILIDEVLTPDSSRFWPQKGYEAGKSQPSFDKQYLRDWLDKQPWDKTPPPPALPKEIMEGTAARYLEAYTLLTGKKLSLPGLL